MSHNDRLAFLPGEDPLLDYYRGTFDTAYIAPHPFFTVPDVNPLDCDYGTQIFLRSEMPVDIDLVEYTNAAREQRFREKRFAWDETQKRIRENG